MYTYCLTLVLNTLDESQDANPKKLPLEGSFVFEGKSKGGIKVIRGYYKKVRRVAIYTYLLEMKQLRIC